MIIRPSRLKTQFRLAYTCGHADFRKGHAMNGSFVLTQGAGQKLEFAINRNRGGPEGVEWLSTGKNFRLVSLLARGECELKYIPRSTITVLPDLTTEQRIAAGNYDEVDSDLAYACSFFDKALVGEWEWDLVRPGRELDCEEARDLIENDDPLKTGWMVAGWAHALAFAATYPESQGIVALGTVTPKAGGRRVLVFGTSPKGRVVTLHSFGGCRLGSKTGYLRVRRQPNLP